MAITYGPKEIIETNIIRLVSRALSDGGFSMRDKGLPRPDATAWASLALTAIRGDNKYSLGACHYLSNVQHEDGRINLIEDAPEACWPTFLSVLAWKKVPGFETQNDKALSFLLDFSGNHWAKTKKQAKVIGHDPALRGWPWIENTHSWVEPTSLAIIALKINGFAEHNRVREGVKMILDRQLSSGGWNYGNKSVYNQELLAMPDCTGQALCALSGSLDRAGVQESLAYLADNLEHIRTPRSLSWCLFGSSAWSVETKNFDQMIYESLLLQNRLGIYDTVELSQLLLALTVQTDFLKFLY